MASLSVAKTGLCRILYATRDCKTRHTLYLGRLPRAAAESVERWVKRLEANNLAGLDHGPEECRWLAKVDADLHEKLSRNGLVAPRPKREATELDAFLTEYIESRTDLKSGTITHLEHAKNDLVAYFGADKDLADITAGDADEFRRWLAPKLGPNSVRRKMGRCKQFFRAAARKKLISESPFADMRDTTVQPNQERDYFLTRADADKIIDACPSAEWRLAFCLSRYGGLRTPSEHKQLKWEDILWAENRIRIRSVKTEHHPNGSMRYIPIFPELVEPLEDCRELAADGEVYVLPRLRNLGLNLRTQFRRIVERAGLEPWPKIFGNLRASRATELEAEHPSHCVRQWLGHSDLVARRFYLRATDDDFARASGATRQTTQQAVESASPGGNTTEQQFELSGVFSENAAVSSEQDIPGQDSNESGPGNENAGFSGSRDCGDAPADAPGHDSADLAYLRAGWPGVSEQVLLDALALLNGAQVEQ